MKTWFKVIWYFAIIANVAAFIWFILGNTANFQRGLDLMGVPTLVLYGIPSIILVVSSILIMKNCVKPKLWIYAVAFIMIYLLIYFVEPMAIAVNKSGWLYDYVESDPIKSTLDTNYSYRLELVNYGQRNRTERLYLKDNTTGEEFYIIVDINTRELRGTRIGPGDDWAWAVMTPTDVTNQYELTTTDNLKMPTKRFLIDINKRKSKRIE
ncbi:hypothetical protein [Alkaliphilus transvaalensis]|uniref:hypothetical protein n=1 Tax=Alkaliphilus transvaalensis TaxID=114628 RepID=UPI00047CA157|nr:hypothetical protein [Alkaliphilus transvaalensis]